MSKRLIPWYAGVLAAEMISAAIGIVAFSYTSIFDFESRIYHMISAELWCSGVWLPLIAGFIGCCGRIKKRLHFAITTAVGIPLAFLTAVCLTLAVIGFIHFRWRQHKKP